LALGAIFHNIFANAKMEVSVAFVGDVAMKALNTRYRGKRHTTSVLSFALSRHLGEVVVSVPRARSEAKREGISLKVKLQKLIIHGMLHLKGLDHEKNNDARRMEQLEEHIFNTV
jgi:probable rRNA maturation factor